MVFVRRVRTASGATGVQIAEYVAGGGQRIVAHLGSAHSEAELGVLLEQAHSMIADEAQGVLDLGVEPLRRTAKLVGEPSQPLLVEDATRRSPSGVEVVGGGRVRGTASRVLYHALVGVYSSLGFDAIGDETFRDLVIARIVEPTSLLDTSRVLEDLGVQASSYATRKRTLGRCAQGAWRDQVAKACFAHALSCGDVSLCLYDVTTLYFEAEREDDLRRVGFSKERRVDPQVVVGLLVDRFGFPLEIGCFEGSKSEKLTILPIVKQFRQRHDMEHMVVVADAGMLSAENLKALDDEEYAFIVGSRTTKAPIDLASHFHWHGDAFTDGQIIDTITPKRGPNRDNDTSVKAEPTWEEATHPTSWRAVWSYSAKRAARDAKTLAAQEERARRVVHGEQSAKTPRFVTVKGEAKALNTKALERAKSLVGLKGYVTNIPATTMPAREVISSYHDLWHVEQSFRMSKTDLAARPMFHHTHQAIEAHLTIVFAALALARTVQMRTGLAIRNVVRQLRPLRSATIAINAALQTFPPDIPPDQQHLLDAIAAESVTH